jgi:predicted ArsR family transcriptional regulator
MQSSRRQIIDILKRSGSATVEELSKELNITSVTVRHHLDVLRSEGLVGEPVVRHRTTSGRPQHLYTLTAQADELFPRNYNGLAEVLISEMKARLDDRQINVIFEGAAARLIADAPHPIAGEPMAARVQRAVDFLNQKGYVADWERQATGVLISTRNCPFDGLADSNPELCSMDLALITSLMGVQIERVCHRTQGDSTCAYLCQTTD